MAGSRRLSTCNRDPSATNMKRHTGPGPRFERGRSLLIAGLNARYTFESRVNIPVQWEKFAQQLVKITSRAGPISYGVCWNYIPNQGFDYLTGVEVTGLAGLPTDFSYILLPPQSYAVFTHADHVSRIPDMLHWIWNDWLPGSGHVPSGDPSFERYDESFDPKNGWGGMEIWVPVRAS